MGTFENGSLENGWYKSNIPTEVVNYLCKVSIKINDDKVVNRDFLADLDIDYELIEQALLEMPSVFSFWMMLLSESEANINLLDRKIKFNRARIHIAILDAHDKKQEELRKQGLTIERMTQGTIKEIIETDEDLNRLEVRLILARKAHVKVRAVVDALRMKSDNLRSLAGFKRQEKQSH